MTAAASGAEPGVQSRLAALGRAFTYATTADEVLEAAVEQAASLLGADAVALLLEDDHDKLRIRASTGAKSRDIDVHEPFDERVEVQLREVLGDAAPGEYLSVPLVARGRVFGLLAVAWSDERSFGEAEEQLLAAIADHTAMALQTTRTESEAQRGAAREAADLRDARDARERSLAALGHDLRSPLHAIQSYAELLQLGVLGPLTERQQDALDRIRLSGRHLLSLVEQMLEMAKLTSGVVRIRRQKVELSTAIAEAVAMVQPEAESRDQSVAVLCEDGAACDADPDQLRRILLNLLGNAVKYTPKGGRIVIEARAVVDGEARACLVEVRDTGPGIPPAQLEEVFQPYLRLSPEDGEAQTEGSGLGLAIARSLAHRMGGDIVARNNADGGACFRLTLRAATGD